MIGMKFLIDLEISSVKEANSRFVYLIVLLATGLTPLELLAQNIDRVKIAHRGSSAERPEHTLAAYELAIDRGANFIEPDLVVTKDLRFIARHENELSETTDVASREEFENRRRDKIIDSGWLHGRRLHVEETALTSKRTLPKPPPVTFLTIFFRFPLYMKLSVWSVLRKGNRPQDWPVSGIEHPTFLLQEEGIDVVDLLLKDLQDLEVKRTRFSFKVSRLGSATLK